MRSMILKLALMGVAAAATVGLAATSASAVEETGATCASSSAVATLSPGLESANAKVQNITVKGTASECTGEAGTSTKYVIHVKTAEGATCATLSEALLAASGSGVLKWGHGHGNSQGTFSLSGGTSALSLTGAIESGPYAGKSLSDTFSGTPVFKGGEPCTKKNKLKKIELTGTTPLTIS